MTRICKCGHEEQDTHSGVGCLHITKGDNHQSSICECKEFVYDHYVSLDELTARIAALEADKKRLVEALEQAANALQEKLVASAGEWATGDVAHDYAVKLVAPYRALLSEVS